MAIKASKPIWELTVVTCEPTITKQSRSKWLGKAQVWTSAAKHRFGQPGIVLLAVNAAMLGDALKWEASRGGALFPHLYASLPVDAVVEVTPLPMGEDGVHIFPDGFPPPGTE